MVLSFKKIKEIFLKPDAVVFIEYKYKKSTAQETYGYNTYTVYVNGEKTKYTNAYFGANCAFSAFYRMLVEVFQDPNYNTSFYCYCTECHVRDILRRHGYTLEEINQADMQAYHYVIKKIERKVND